MSIDIIVTNESRCAAGIPGKQPVNFSASYQRPASSFLRCRKAPIVTRDRIRTIVEESIGSVCRIPEGVVHAPHRFRYAIDHMS